MAAADPDVRFAFVDRDGDRLEVRTGSEAGGSICTYSRENDEWTGTHLPASRHGIAALINAILQASGTCVTATSARGYYVEVDPR